MKEHPIIFSGPMVQAILEGHKTQTRRVIKGLGSRLGDEYCTELRNGELIETATLCPYGVAGDHLWVRETWGCSYVDAAQSRPHVVGGTWGSPSRPDRVPCVVFLADGPIRDESPYETARPAPSIHMPRWASRITLEIVSVRVERLQGISEDDARAEGVELESIQQWSGHAGRMTRFYRHSFRRLWDSINAKRGFGWSVNPWVWVIEFKAAQP